MRLLPLPSLAFTALGLLVACADRGPDSRGDDDDSAMDDDDSAMDDDDSAMDDDDSAMDDDDSAADDDDSGPDDDDSGPDCTEDIVVQGLTLLGTCAGEFEMGCTANQFWCDAEEIPPHFVTLTHGFHLGATEVTRAAWTSVMGNEPSFYTRYCETPDCPVDSVSWQDAVSLVNTLSTAEGLPPCYALTGCTGTPGIDLVCLDASITSPSGSVYDCPGYRLPTEAEFEYAARAGTDLPYAGSEVSGDVGWTGGNSPPSNGCAATTHSVGTLLPNGWGFFDMTGNLEEWTSDRYDRDYYSVSPGIDPEGPVTGELRPRRGGHAGGPTSTARIPARSQAHPTVTSFSSGFRIARTAP
jgi:formylglycine-generating enzyme required for sulfatase activity